MPDGAEASATVLAGLVWNRQLKTPARLPKSTGHLKGLHWIRLPAGVFRIDSRIEHW
jgi:hypothetical protein